MEKNISHVTCAQQVGANFKSNRKGLARPISGLGAPVLYKYMHVESTDPQPIDKKKKRTILIRVPDGSAAAAGGSFRRRRTSVDGSGRTVGAHVGQGWSDVGGCGRALGRSRGCGEAGRTELQQRAAGKLSQ